MTDMHPLGRLITERMEHPDNNWSLRDVVKRAQARGEKLGKSNLGKLKNGPTPQLSREMVFGLAAGLGVTPLTVANAALASWGIDPHPSEVTDCLETIRIDPSLGERQRRELVALVRSMRSASSDDTQTTSPPVDAATAASIAKLEIDRRVDDAK